MGGIQPTINFHQFCEYLSLIFTNQNPKHVGNLLHIKKLKQVLPFRFFLVYTFSSLDRDAYLLASNQFQLK